MTMNYIRKSQHEPQRLEYQHRLLAQVIGGLSPCDDLLRKALAPADGVERYAVDIGSGSGIWCAKRV
jgi:hypothetical protein